MFDIDWSRFIDPTYWFEGIITTAGSGLVTPPLENNSSFYWLFLNLFTVLVVGGILLKLYKSFVSPENPLAKRLPIFADNIIWMGILGYLWFISRQLSIAFLGARFWLLVLGTWFIILSFISIRYIIRFFPLEMRYYKKTLSNK